MRKQLIGLLACGAVVAAVGWLLMEDPGTSTSPVAAVAVSGPPGTLTTILTPPRRATPSFEASRDAMLTPALVPIFERVLSEAQAQDKAAFMAKAPALLAQYIPEPLRVRALALLERYVDMQEALRSVPPGDTQDLASARRAMDARADVRRRYFAPEEVEGIFGDEIRQDNFMLEKMEIVHNESLTPAQREEALRSTEAAWLSSEQITARRESTAAGDLVRETAQLDARGATPQERYADRAARYGNQVATGLANLDRENEEWNRRLDQYANAPASQQEQLRDSLFDDNERMRLEGALALRASSLTPAGSPPSPTAANQTSGRTPS